MISIIILISFSCTQTKIAEFKGTDKSVIAVSSGTQFKIIVAEDHAAGQTWSLVNEPDAAIVEYQKSEFRGSKSGLTDFLFDAKNKGEVIVKLKLVEYSHIKEEAEITVRVE